MMDSVIEIVNTNGADPELFNLLDVFIPIVTSGEFMRSSRKVTECMFFSENQWRDISLPGSGPKPDPNILDFLEGYPDNEPRTVEAVRTAWIKHMTAWKYPKRHTTTKNTEHTKGE